MSTAIDLLFDEKRRKHARNLCIRVERVSGGPRTCSLCHQPCGPRMLVISSGMSKFWTGFCFGCVEEMTFAVEES